MHGEYPKPLLEPVADGEVLPTVINPTQYSNLLKELEKLRLTIATQSEVIDNMIRDRAHLRDQLDRRSQALPPGILEKTGKVFEVISAESSADQTKILNAVGHLLGLGER